jgi:hypothetical protein
MDPRRRGRSSRLVIPRDAARSDAIVLDRAARRNRPLQDDCH